MATIKPDHIKNWVERNFECKPRSNGAQLAINNPFDGDTGFHLWISLKPAISKRTKRADYWVHDFRPHHQIHDGSFVNFVKNYRNISYFDALKEVCGSSSGARTILRASQGALDSPEEDAKPEEQLKLPPCTLIDKAESKLEKIAINYLKRRMVPIECAKANNLQFDAGSIIFPYLEYGEIVYWQARSILTKNFMFPDNQKCGVSKSDFIYGFDNVEPNSTIIVNEAIFDSLVIGDAIATGGAIISGRQFRKIKALNPHTIILAPDNDDAGVASMRKNYENLKSKIDVNLMYCFPPIDKKNDDLNDWNGYEQKHGHGWSRKYIKENSKKIGIRDLVRPKVEYV
jgi:hypothetical protein